MACASCGHSKPHRVPCPSCGGTINKQSGGNHLSDQTARSIRVMLMLGRSVRSIAEELGTSKVTVGVHRKAFEAERGGFVDIFCACGQQAFHKGWCTERLKLSPSRQAFLRQWNEGRKRLPKIIPIRTPLTESYPFIPESGRVKSDGLSMVLLVNGMVPRGLPEQLRGDVCQELIASVLLGEFTETEIPLHVKSIIARVRHQQEGHYMAISLDQPMRDGRSWHDVLAA